MEGWKADADMEETVVLKRLTLAKWLMLAKDEAGMVMSTSPSKSLQQQRVNKHPK